MSGVIPPSCREQNRHPLREIKRASHSQLLPGAWSGDWSQKTQQIEQAVAPLHIEGHTQRLGQRSLAQKGHESSTGFFPKSAAHKGIQPPLTPPLQGAAVNPNGLAQRAQALGLDAMNHGRDQHDDKAGVDPATQEAHRGGSRPSPTALLGATEAVALIPLGAATRFAVVIGPVKFAPAQATLLMGLRSQIGIDFLQ